MYKKKYNFIITCTEEVLERVRFKSRVVLVSKVFLLSNEIKSVNPPQKLTESFSLLSLKNQLLIGKKKKQKRNEKKYLWEMNELQWKNRKNKKGEAKKKMN